MVVSAPTPIGAGVPALFYIHCSSLLRLSEAFLEEMTSVQYDESLLSKLKDKVVIITGLSLM